MCAYQDSDNAGERSLAIKAAVKTCNILDYTKCRLIRIRDTLIWARSKFPSTCWRKPSVIRISRSVQPYDWSFNDEGNLFA